jgi:hypothetical protein
MIVQLKTSNDVWSEDKEGRLDRLIKKGVIVLCEIETDHITYVSEVINSRGNISKNKCKIIIRGSEVPIIVNHSYQYISKLRQTQIIKGFRR